MKTIIVTLLLCFLVASAAGRKGSTSSQSIQLDVFDGSNAWWLAFAVRNAGVDTKSVQIQQAGSSSWEAMDYTGGWDRFTYSSRSKLSLPISIRLTSVSGAQVTVENAIRTVKGGVINTGLTYSSGTNANPTSAPANPTSSPTASATTRPTNTATSRPTNAATGVPTSAPAATSRPTNAATTRPAATTNPTRQPATSRPATAAPTTKAATTAPTTKAATTAPTTKAATTAPTTKAATTRATVAPTTKAATTAPSSGSGCAGPLKLLVPLYSYPTNEKSSWEAVAANGKSVPTVAIINPSSGPGNGPDSTFTTYMNKLNAGGVEMVGYVATGYAKNSISSVKAQIDIYASKFPLLDGIFLDEVSAAAGDIAYYQQLYDYIMGMPGWKYDILNPGAIPAAGYANVATQIVTYESAANKFASSSNPTWASCAQKDKFAVIAYGISSSAMNGAVDAARSKGYYGWVYFTDGASGCCTYNLLTSYYTQMATYIANGNK